MKNYTSFCLIFFMLCGTHGMDAQDYTLRANAPNHEYHDRLAQWFKDYQVYQVNTSDLKSIITDHHQRIDLQWDFEGRRPFGMSLTNENLLSQHYATSTSIRMFHGYRLGGGLASLTFNTQLVYGFFDEQDIRWRIEPLRYIIPEADPALYIMYRVDDYIQSSGKICGVTQQEKIEEKIKNSVVQLNQCYIEEMAIASTYDMVQHYGTVAEVEDHNIAVMNDVQTNYRHEFDDNLEFKIVTQFTPATAADDPWTSSTNASTLLSDFRAWGNGGGFGSVTYDIAQMWTYRNLDGSTVGIAYVNTVCTSSRYHLCQDYTTNSESLRVLTAHEIGHNHNASHDPSGSQFIMAPSVTITNDWSSASRSAISAHINSRGCLANCSTEGSPIADFTASTSIICSGSAIDFKDFSEFGATRTWTFAGGSPANATTAKPNVTYNTIGNFNVQITSNNGALSDTKLATNFVKVSAPPPAPSCSPSGSGGAGGLRFFSIHKLSNSTSNTPIYNDFSCDQIANLQPDTRYGVSFTAGGSVFEQFKLYIDYNNNGTFESGEFACQSNSLWSGGPIDSTNDAGLKFTTPSASSITQDVVLRMRAIVDDGGVPGPCHTPSSGEVEDYGAAFASAPLPVRLLDFNANIEMNQIILKWITAQEKNTSYFEIERSLNGQYFSSIGQLSAQGRSNQLVRYTFVDQNIHSGLLYYRLRMVDADGQITYSNIISVQLRTHQEINIYPIPARDRLTISLPTDGPFDIQIIDLFGQIRYADMSRQDKVKIPLDNIGLKDGIYLIKIMRGSELIKIRKIYVRQ